MDISEKFAEKLRYILDTSPHGLQKQVADEVGISATHMNNIVHARRKSDEDTRRAICRSLGIDYEKFLFGGQSVTVDKETKEITRLLMEVAPPAFKLNLLQRLNKMKALSDFD